MINRDTPQAHKKASPPPILAAMGFAAMLKNPQTIFGPTAMTDLGIVLPSVYWQENV